MDREDYFTLAFFGEEHREALNLCGRVSGRDEDKIKEAGLTPYYVDGTVAFEEAKMIFVCKKVYVQRMGELRVLFRSFRRQVPFMKRIYIFRML